MKLFNKIKNILIVNWGKYFPKSRVEYLYKKSFGHPINWTNPQEMNEKIRWLQFNNDTSKWSLLADKYQVGIYLKEAGYGQYIVPIYGVWNNANDIDFEQLPNSFVLKTTHGAGSVYIIEDKGSIDLKQLIKNLNNDLKQKYGLESVESHYLKIHPRIIAEKLLHQNIASSTSLIDYKFYVANGNPICCGVMFNRDIKSHKYDVSIYDMNWIKHNEWLKKNKTINSSYIERPINWETMIKLCNDLCSEFPFVRFDLYECNGNLYIGEFTFTPSALNGGSLSNSLCQYIGSKIKL